MQLVASELPSSSRREILQCDVGHFAIHEAAHAVAAAVLGSPICSIEIANDGGAFRSRAPSKRASDKTEREIAHDLCSDWKIADTVWVKQKLIELSAGGYAEWCFYGKANDDVDREYIGLVSRAATECWRQQATLIRTADAKARRLVDEYWHAIEDLAIAVLSSPRRRLEANEIWRVLAAHGFSEPRSNWPDGEPLRWR